MKTVHGLVLSTFVFAALTAGAVADSADTGDSHGVPVDQDGIPLSVTNPQPKQPTPEEIAAYQKIQTQAEADKDWLLRAYEKERQQKVSDDGNNLYYRLSSNKELAGLAGLPTLEASSQDPAGKSRADATDPLQEISTQGADSSATNGVASPRVSFKPLITPLGSADAAGLHSFYSSLQPTASPSLLSGSTPPQPAPAAQPQEDQDPSAIETPGLIAAEKDPLFDKSAANLTLDLLARDPADHAGQPQDNNSTKLELPLPTNTALLQKTQDAALTAPGTVKAIPVTPAHPDPALQNTDEPTPIEKMPQASPVRSPIADPHDIFYR